MITKDNTRHAKTILATRRECVVQRVYHTCFAPERREKDNEGANKTTLAHGVYRA